jgi:phytoene dehydrogenase-like protein
MIGNLEMVKLHFEALAPFDNDFMANFIREVSNKWQDACKEYLKKNLSELGYSFNSDLDFIVFCKSRVTRITLAGSRKYDYYLDYVNTANTGKFIGSVSDKSEFSREGDKINITIG